MVLIKRVLIFFPSRYFGVSDLFTRRADGFFAFFLSSSFAGQSHFHPAGCKAVTGNITTTTVYHGKTPVLLFGVTLQYSIAVRYHCAADFWYSYFSSLY